jgi:hypothetical protein
MRLVFGSLQEAQRSGRGRVVRLPIAENGRELLERFRSSCSDGYRTTAAASAAAAVAAATTPVTAAASRRRPRQSVSASSPDASFLSTWSTDTARPLSGAHSDHGAGRLNIINGSGMFHCLAPATGSAPAGPPLEASAMLRGSLAMVAVSSAEAGAGTGAGGARTREDYNNDGPSPLKNSRLSKKVNASSVTPTSHKSPIRLPASPEAQLRSSPAPPSFKAKQRCPQPSGHPSAPQPDMYPVVRRRLADDFEFRGMNSSAVHATPPRIQGGDDSESATAIMATMLLSLSTSASSEQNLSHSFVSLWVASRIHVVTTRCWWP